MGRSARTRCQVSSTTGMEMGCPGFLYMTMALVMLLLSRILPFYQSERLDRSAVFDHTVRGYDEAVKYPAPDIIVDVHRD